MNRNHWRGLFRRKFLRPRQSLLSAGLSNCRSAASIIFIAVCEEIKPS
jgi:hypothetical protein